MPGIGVLVKSEASYVQSEAPRTRTPIICTHQIVDSNSEPAHHFAQRIDELKTEPLSNPYEKQRTNPMGHAINQSINQCFKSSMPNTTSSASPVITFVEAVEACFLCALPFLLTTFNAGSSTRSVSSPKRKPRLRRWSSKNDEGAFCGVVSGSRPLLFPSPLSSFLSSSPPNIQEYALSASGGRTVGGGGRSSGTSAVLASAVLAWGGEANGGEFTLISGRLLTLTVPGCSG
jgi:hypothetical protein